MSHIAWVTNIPTPYRNHRYEMMDEVFPEYGLSFEVLYMAWSERGRVWKFKSEELRYPHRVMPDVNFRISGVNQYVNPRLLAHLRRSRPDIVVVGGFSAPTLIAAPFFSPRKAIRLLGVESNIASAGHTGGLIQSLKRRIVAMYDGFIVPGDASREYVEHLDAKAALKPFITLPNIVDRAKFPQTLNSENRADGFRNDLRIRDGQQMWLCVARLESFKGLVEFLPLLKGLKNVQLIVAGEGSQQTTLERIIASQNLPARLIGHLGTGELSKFYAAADVFVLPSNRDASPLAAVEAAASALPMILTWQVGNARDLIVNNENGWIIDTAEPDAVRETLIAVAAMSRSDLTRMGRKSLARYEYKFDSESSIRHLATKLRSLVPK